MMNGNEKSKMYHCWLDYQLHKKQSKEWIYGNQIYCAEDLLKEGVIQSAIDELKLFFLQHFDLSMDVVTKKPVQAHIALDVAETYGLKEGAYEMVAEDNQLLIHASSCNGILYGAFGLIQVIKRQIPVQGLKIKEEPTNKIRMINHWDNSDGSIERGYAGKSIFYHNNEIIQDMGRIKDYARLLASVGINSICINNVNVHHYETQFITDIYLKDIARIAKVFEAYGIRLFLSINFAAPISLDHLENADPLNTEVREWWRKTAEHIYKVIPNLGGFLVKADSENRPGPFTYGRTHAEGANMLADAVRPYGGLVIWRCFVYNCHVDWRDRETDRARAAYDHFIDLDGQFNDNVILQIKNGPMDFQIREPLSPLFGGLENTNQILEFQITQEYTGQQKHICFLVPMWKECLDFDTYAKGENSRIKDIVSGNLFGNKETGIAGVVNIGDSECWSGNPMAAANLYGFGRLCWNPHLSSKEIADEWISLTLGLDKKVHEVVSKILLTSRKTYEDYTVPLGIGWMVNVGHHYGPNIEGYEYSPWGTYHYADYKGIGVDRTSKTGTGYVNQYLEPNRSLYEDIKTCPEELLLFFHHVSYDYQLKDGRTLLQYIYDVHFEGVEQVRSYQKAWESLDGSIDRDFYNAVSKGLEVQLKDAKEWRDVVNTYFYRRTGIGDSKNRKIYE